MSKKEVESVEAAAVPSLLSANMFKADAGKGTSAIEQEDLALPFMKIFSGLEDIPDGGKKGDIHNTVTGQIWSGSEGLDVILAMFNKRFILWGARGTGPGAPLAIYSPGDPNIPKVERSPDDNKDYVVGGGGEYLETTAQHYLVLLHEDGTHETALLSMKSTQIKKSRKWMSMVMSRNMTDDEGMPFTPPAYAYIYKLKTVSEENSKGKWYGWDISLADNGHKGVLQDASAYNKAKVFADSIMKGEVTVKHSAEENVVEKENVPF